MRICLSAKNLHQKHRCCKNYFLIILKKGKKSCNISIQIFFYAIVQEVFS